MHLDDFLFFGSIGFIGCEFVNSADVVARVMMEVWFFLGGVV